MTLGQAVMTALEEAKQRGALGHLEDGRFSVQRDGAQVTLRIADFDRLGFLLNEVKVEWDVAMSAAEAQACAERIAQRVTYLTEDLTLVEWTQPSANAMLRSAPQEMQGQRMDYFELRLCEGRALVLRRYHPCAEAPGRDEATFHLTTDLLTRLLNDLDAPPAPPSVTI
jgi:hypothetical protein